MASRRTKTYDLRESAPQRVLLDERTASPLAETHAVRDDGTADVLIISPGWGSSGYYSADVLTEAADAGVFAAGIQMYLDHPTSSEQVDRPERSVRDLAAVTVEAGRYLEDGRAGAGVYAAARIFAPFRDHIDEIAEVTGVSIRGVGTGHFGRAEGRSGRIIDELVEIASVDFVTRAGRGGRLLALAESLAEARNVADWIEVEIHRYVMGLADSMWGEGGRLTRDEWTAVSQATMAAMDAFRADLAASSPELLTRDPAVTPTEARDAAVEGLRNFRAPAGHTDPEQDHTEEADVPLTDEEVTRIATAVGDTVGEAIGQLAEKLGPAAPDPHGDEGETMSEAERENERLRDALAQRDAQDAARETIAESHPDLPARAAARVVEQVSTNPPVDTDGKLDRDKLTEAVTEAVEAETTYLAEVTGRNGKPRGMGTTGLREATTVEEREAAQAAEAEWFESVGLSPEAAKRAARGRN